MSVERRHKEDNMLPSQSREATANGTVNYEGIMISRCEELMSVVHVITPPPPGARNWPPKEPLTNSFPILARGSYGVQPRSLNRRLRGSPMLRLQQQLLRPKYGNGKCSCRDSDIELAVIVEHSCADIMGREDMPWHLGLEDDIPTLGALSRQLLARILWDLDQMKCADSLMTIYLELLRRGRQAYKRLWQRDFQILRALS